ncbi:helix-turn-helix domain-containing protein [Actinomadura geliboluensis]|uniref:Helix-turn-helix domain-containing protein n=1 Tax=Actinomadura geliboluensis TaxID=882440 RepID=A0A5S4HET0_9ACTN|nr:helix-turn-helix transcriptional regulator [Actinomadura geliboluensis]TMR37410.1 helix-turn-helix domain-containing protein [Actinomadura geliboluensis]
MVQQPTDFGAELRRRRLESDMTLTGLAQRVHYSKAQLSKVERGIKKPSRELARLCDAALAADGALAALVPENPSGIGVTVDADGDEEVWLMQLSSQGQSRFQPMSRRQAVAAGAASIAGVSIGLPAISTNVEDTTLVGTFRSLFDQYRQLGQTTSPGLLLPVLIAQTHALQELSKTAGARTRQALLRLGSRYAEYIGWLVQETGDEHGALWWTQRAVDLADAGGDHHLAAYSLVRRALVTLYRGDPGRTIGLARQAQSSDVTPRIRGLAAQREAQGHALAGDYHACMRSLEQARALLACSGEGSGAPVIGTTNLTDPAEMVRGWCLYDLGRPRAAAQIIETQLAQVPEQAVRTQVRFGLRRALAHAADGEIDHACRLTQELLPRATTIGSATVATDLRALARTLSRHPKNRSVRALAPELGTALGTTTRK